MEDISSEEFMEILNSQPKKFHLIDVREELEYHTYNEGGINIPLGRLASVLDKGDLEIDEEDFIVVICQRGIRSKTAKTILMQHGYNNVSNLLGGLLKLQRIKLS